MLKNRDQSNNVRNNGTFMLQFSNEMVEYGKGEYVTGEAHINTAEGYFSQLKRSIDGTHHHVSLLRRV